MNRADTIRELWLDGYSYREIGRQLGISGARVGQIVHEAPGAEISVRLPWPLYDRLAAQGPIAITVKAALNAWLAGAGRPIS